MKAVENKGKAVVKLPTDKQILITRTFDAPRHLVYRAWTTPELVKRWWHASEVRSGRTSTCGSGRLALGDGAETGTSCFHCDTARLPNGGSVSTGLEGGRVTNRVTP